MQEMEHYGETTGKRTLDKLAAEAGDPDKVGDVVKVKPLNLPEGFNDNLVHIEGSCPTLPEVKMGMFGTVQIPTDMI